jgi:hypothetical protein
MADQTSTEPVILTYTIETVIGRHGYTIELIATSETRAISRARGTMFHKLRTLRAMEAEYIVTEVRPFDPKERRRD